MNEKQIVQFQFQTIIANMFLRSKESLRKQGWEQICVVTHCNLFVAWQCHLNVRPSHYAYLVFIDLYCFGSAIILNIQRKNWM